VTIPELKLHAGDSKKVKIRYTLPTGLTDGDYQMLAQGVATATQTAPAVVAATVTLATPRVDLSADFATTQPIRIEAGSTNTVKVTISNLGNVTAKGSATLNLYASEDGAVDGADAVLKTIDLKSLRIKAGHSKTIRIHVKPTTQQMTLAHNLLATLVSTTDPADDNAADDLAVGTLV
jgi:uncharacterized membrane protein